MLPAEAKDFMSRELLYTALTRAKKKLIVLVDEGLLKDSTLSRELLQKWGKSGYDAKIISKIGSSEIEKRYTLLFQRWEESEATITTII